MVLPNTGSDYNNQSHLRGLRDPGLQSQRDKNIHTRTRVFVAVLTLLRLTTLISYRTNFEFPYGDSNIMGRAATRRVLSTPELIGTIFRYLWNDFGDRDKTQEAGRCCWLSLVVPGLTLSGIEELCGCSGGTDYCRLQCIVRSTERAD